jgi:hypothetical protein
MTNDSVTTILETVKSDMTSVILQETLSAAGLYTHISDSNSQYKHRADNIEYTETDIDASGNTNVVTMSLADKLRSITGAADATAPSVEFNLQKDSSTYGGKLVIKAPNLSKGDRKLVDTTMRDYTNKTIYPFFTRILQSF